MTDAECLAKRTELLAVARQLPEGHPYCACCEAMAGHLLDMASDDPIIRCDGEQLYEAAKRELECDPARMDMTATLAAIRAGEPYPIRYSAEKTKQVQQLRAAHREAGR